jgi:hypothetical protein
MNDERMTILKRIETGEIKAEEAVRLINELGQAPTSQPEPESVEPEPEPEKPAPPPVPKGLAQFWIYPLFAGVGVIVLGAILLYAVYAARAGWGWAVCGWPLFALGVIVTAVAWWLRTARWIHVRVTGKEHVAISIPIPLRLTAWVLKIARPFVPKLRDTGVDEVIMGMADTLGKDGQPIYVDVDDEDEGEHVQVYIG